MKREESLKVGGVQIRTPSLEKPINLEKTHILKGGLTYCPVEESKAAHIHKFTVNPSLWEAATKI
jgi:hypothetical protein